jgi:hypothetical protein
MRNRVVVADDGFYRFELPEGINNFAFHFRFYRSSTVSEDIVNQIAEKSIKNFALM